MASQWIDYADPRVKSEEQQLSDWWTVFNDPTLNSLIQTAYQQNLTLRAAAHESWRPGRCLASPSAIYFRRSNSRSANTRELKLSENIANPPPAVWFSEWTFGLSGSWELDFWGRYRRAIEAADAELDASVEDYDDVLVVLLSDVAASYVRISHVPTAADLRSCQCRHSATVVSISD